MVRRNSIAIAIAVAVAVAVAVVPLLVVLVVTTLLLRRVGRNSRRDDESNSHWENRDCRCPECSTAMHRDFVLMGKGMIWTPRRDGGAGVFSHIRQVLDSTISLRLTRR